MLRDASDSRKPVLIDRKIDRASLGQAFLADLVSNPGKDTYGSAANFLKRTRLSVHRIAVTPGRPQSRSNRSAMQNPCPNKHMGPGAVILADQVLEAVALGKSLRLVRAARSLELRADPIADADCGPAG